MEGGELTLRPSAARLLESMRDIGYSFESALADIVDNSISAGATEIRIVNDLDPEAHPYLAIMDNGRGMRPDALTAAMRHGSRSPREARDAGDLGRFGLGMKTASFSQCRRLTVASRVDGVWAARRWDLDRVVETDEWLLHCLGESEIAELPMIEQMAGEGTLVLWQKLDRLDAMGSHPEQAYAALNEMFASAQRHLALTFHRFIAPEPNDGVSPVRMTINGASVDALDPFARLMLPQSDAHEIEALGHGSSEIFVQAFTLPHHKRLTLAQLAELELGESLVQTQGLYVYRARRLIAGGTWLGLARKAELTKLLRVRVDVPNSLDAEWSIDIRKSRVRTPAVIRDRLRPLIRRMTEAAKRPYIYRGTRQATLAGLPMWARIEERGAVRYEVCREHPLIEALQKATGARANVEPILIAIETMLPLETLFADVAGSPETMRQQDMDAGELEQLLAAFVEAMAPGRDTLPAAVAGAILTTSIFANQPTARAVLEQMRRIED
jgi:hypothetical protein